MNYLAPILSVVANPDWKIYHDFHYGNDPQQVGDLYLLNKGEHPLIIMIHGGGWSSGDKSSYAGRARRYALAGFHVFAINYRLAKFDDKSTQWPAQFDDVKRACAWMTDSSFGLRIDTSRICVCGDSAGGHLALMLGVADRPKCILNMFGPCDPRLMNDLLSKLPIFGGGPIPNNACPIDSICADFPPTLTIHGTKDTTVAYEQAMRLDSKLAALGVDHALISYDGGHEFADLPWWKEELIELRALWWVISKMQ